MSEINGIQALGGFTDEQVEIIQMGVGLPVQNIADHTEVTPGNLLVVRGGMAVPIESTKEISAVISAGRGTENIGASRIPVEERTTLVGNCGGLEGNGPEVAVHAVGLLHLAIQDKLQKLRSQELQALYLDAISKPGSVLIVGAGGVGVNTALLLRELGIDATICRSPSKPSIPELGIVNDLEAVILNSLIVIIAADQPGVLNEELVSLMGEETLIINMARGNTITENAYNQICRRKLGLYADVWPEEPKKDGDEIGDKTLRLLKLSDSRRSACGTMHEAARQRSAEIAIAHTLVQKINHFLETGQILPNTDPISLLQRRNGNIHFSNWEKFFADVELSPDLCRVIQLRDHLLDIVDNSLRWQIFHLDPDPAESSLVKLLRKH